MNLVKKKTINSLTQWHSVKDKQRSLAILVHPAHSSLSLSPPLSPYPPQCALISSISPPLSPYPHSVHSYHLSLYTSFPISPTLSHYITTNPLSLSPYPSPCHTTAQRTLASSHPLSLSLATSLTMSHYSTA